MCVAKLRSSFGISDNKGFKGPFVILRAHSRVWIGSMLYKAFCLVYHGSSSNNREHPRQWESGLVRIRNVWMFEWVCSFWVLFKGLKSQRNYILILMIVIIMMMMDSRDDVGFSSVSWIRQGLLELDHLGDSPFQNWGLIKINTQSGII